MKKLSSIKLWFAFIVIVLINSCKEERELQLGEPFSKLEGINGTWKLVQILQTDGLATDPTKRQLELPSDFLGDTPMILTFDSATKTYSTQVGTTILNLIGDNGNWEFDDDNYPTAISFNNNWWGLLTPTRTVDNVLKVATAHHCIVPDDTGTPIPTATVIYIYTFERQ